MFVQWQITIFFPASVLMLKMRLGVRQVLFLPLLIAAFWHSVAAENEKETSKRLVTVPRRIESGGVIDGSGTEHIVYSNGTGDAMGEWQDGIRVSASTVACFTLAMAAATGLGAVPFFFVELDPQWAGICSGMAAGVMLAASFDLIQEGQGHGNGSLVVLGILAGGLFILLCKKYLEQYGEVSMLDIKGAEAAKAILVVGIMTLHSFGEGSGVGVSFAGTKGLSQGILVTLAIAVHNIPEGLAVSMVLASRGVSPQNAMLWSVITSLPQPLVAVPSFLFADAFNKFLPFATGFAAGCMIWMVITEVLPDGFKETYPSHVASAATLSVAFMVALSAVFDHLSQNYNPEDASGFFLSLLFGLGPLLGGCVLVAFALAFHLHHSLLTSIASGIAFVLGAWRTLQLLFSSKLGLFPLLFILGSGSAFFHLSSSLTTKLGGRKKTSANMLSDVACFPISTFTIQSILSCSAVALHALAEGLALVVAMPHAYGLGGHMVLPVFLHGFPQGVAAASCIFGATDNWNISLLSAALIGLVCPLSAVGAKLARINHNMLHPLMVFACGGLFPCFWSIFRRALKLDKRKSALGVVIGAVLASLCLTYTKLVYSML